MNDDHDSGDEEAGGKAGVGRCDDETDASPASTEIKRDKLGRWEKGQTGNRNGRPSRPVHSNLQQAFVDALGRPRPLKGRSGYTSYNEVWAESMAKNFVSSRLYEQASALRVMKALQVTDLQKWCKARDEPRFGERLDACFELTGEILILTRQLAGWARDETVRHEAVIRKQDRDYQRLLDGESITAPPRSNKSGAQIANRGTPPREKKGGEGRGKN